MGGCSYDRDVYSSGDNFSSSGFHHSPLADQAFTKSDISDLDKRLLPINRTLECSTQNALVIELDVTGSMGDNAKMLYDKFPMLWGQLEQQNYLEDFSISIVANGDCTCDGAPIQVCDFAAGKKLDTWIKRLFLEGGGGGQGTETYEMPAYFYAHKVRFTHPKADQQKPFYISIGDEAPNASIPRDALETHFGNKGKAEGDLSSADVFKQVREKYHYKHIHIPYGGDATTDTEVKRQWKKYIGSDLISVAEPKAVVDVLIGVVALTTGKRTLPEYLQDMRDRGQTDERVQNVATALKHLAEELGRDGGGGAASKGKGKTTRL